VTALAMIMRWISDVPSKIVKLVDLQPVSAGRCPVDCRRPVPALACAAGRLSGPARHVHRAVLAAFMAAGQPPPAAELQRRARGHGDNPDRVRAELALGNDYEGYW
jgi:hypothetical protein